MGDPGPFRVLIAGGGVAAVEAMLALRELVGERTAIGLLAPDEELTLKPLAIGEAFGLSEPPRLRLEDLTRDLGASRHPDTLASVDVDARVARTGAGEEISYAALLLAIGAQPLDALRGVITYRGGPDNDRLAELLAEIDAGTVHRVTFVVPAAVDWPLPVYELALMTAARAAAGGGPGAELTLVTHESRPLALFGPAASETVEGLLRDAGIELVTGARAVEAGPVGLTLADGRVIDGDRVVAAPRLAVPEFDGLPQGPDGFFDTDPQMRVKGAPGVYAAGDSTWFPIKQGGIAAQQADVAASAIASLIDAAVEVAPFRPTLRGALFTGSAPRFLRADVGRRALTSAAGTAPLWWPPSKIAGRHLASYLAERHDFSGPLRDLEALDQESESAGREHEDALAVALAAADSDAAEGDHRGALRWLEVAESVNLALPAEYAEKRRAWTQGARLED